MPITGILKQNARKYGPEIALVEINPEVREDRRVTWKEYELIERGASEEFRREITWAVFDEKANRCANLLLSRGIKKGEGRDPADELPGMAAHLLRHPQDRRAGGADELPLLRGRDPVLRGPG